MNGESICRLISKLLNEVVEYEGTATTVEEIRAILREWDEYACWGEDA